MASISTRTFSNVQIENTGDGYVHLKVAHNGNREYHACIDTNYDTPPIWASKDVMDERGYTHFYTDIATKIGTAIFAAAIREGRLRVMVI